MFLASLWKETKSGEYKELYTHKNFFYISRSYE